MTAPALSADQATPHLITRADVWHLYKQALAKGEPSIACDCARMANHNYLRSWHVTLNERAMRCIVLAAYTRLTGDRIQARALLQQARLFAWLQHELQKKGIKS